MEEQTPGSLPHVERVTKRPQKPSLRLPPGSPHDFPTSFLELVEWYTHEVEDMGRAMQMRIKEASAFVDDCANRKINLDEARQRMDEYCSKWPDPFPGGVGWTRGKSDEEINQEWSQRKADRLQRAAQARGRV